MVQRFKTDNLVCTCSADTASAKIAYILYPMDNIPGSWIEQTAAEYGISVAVITGMDWQNAFSPWPGKGVPQGTSDFKGESPEFLLTLRQEVIPQLESHFGICSDPERTLTGVSMSGLFALWQWMRCDTFLNIASLSGSFWYEGFLQWMKSTPIPNKKGKAYFLLGEQEKKSRIKEFQSVGADTSAIVELLSGAGIDVTFESVPGNHYSDPIPRLDSAFRALFIHQ